MATSTTASTPTSVPSTPPSEPQPTSLSHLKELVSQLQAKIERLESQAVSAVKEAVTPSQHLRIVLMGPPGAGEFFGARAGSLL